MARTQTSPLDTEVWDCLSLRAKVQTICDAVDSVEVEDLLSMLLILDSSVNCYVEARRYLVERVIAMILQCNRIRVKRLRDDFLRCVEKLSNLSFIEERYVDDFARSIDDIIYSSDSESG